MVLVQQELELLQVDHSQVVGVKIGREIFVGDRLESCVRLDNKEVKENGSEDQPNTRDENRLQQVFLKSYLFMHPFIVAVRVLGVVCISGLIASRYRRYSHNFLKSI